MTVIIFIQNKPELIGCQCELPSVPDLIKLHSVVLEMQHYGQVDQHRFLYVHYAVCTKNA